jgi:hypothetical protein
MSTTCFWNNIQQVRSKLKCPAHVSGITFSRYAQSKKIGKPYLLKVQLLVKNYNEKQDCTSRIT